MNLGDKAQWHLDFNKGFVPILESSDGTMINESAVISQFASEFAKASDGVKLWPCEGTTGDLSASMETGKLRLAMLEWDAFMPKFFACYMGRFADKEKIEALAE